MGRASSVFDAAAVEGFVGPRLPAYTNRVNARKSSWVLVETVSTLIKAQGESVHLLHFLHGIKYANVNPEGSVHRKEYVYSNRTKLCVIDCSSLFAKLYSASSSCTLKYLSKAETLCWIL